MRELSNEEMKEVNGGYDGCWYLEHGAPVGILHGGTISSWGGSMPYGTWECVDGVWVAS